MNYEQSYKKVMSKPINEEKNFNGGFSKNGYYYKPSKLTKDQKNSQTKADYSLSGNYTDKNGNLWYSTNKQLWQERDNGSKGIETRKGVWKLLNLFDK